MPVSAMELVRDGVRHQGGELPRILRGEERLRAHDAIREATNLNGPHARASVDKDLALLEWVKRDASLFVERIPERNPQSFFARSWSSQRTWWGTWAYRAASAGFYQSVGELFKLGVHPDDGNVFSVRPLWMDAWNSKPERIAELLTHGANPDSIQSIERKGGFRANPHHSPVRRCIEVMRGNAVSLSFLDASGKVKNPWGTPDDAGKRDERLRAIRQAIESANLLLKAGARKVDPSLHDFLDDAGGVVAAAATQGTAVGALTKVLGYLKSCPDEREMVMQLLVDVCAAGADVSRTGGDSQLAPVVMAIRAQDLETFTLLVGLGAEVRDSLIMRSEPECAFRTDSVVKSLTDEAEDVGGHHFKSQVTEALMQQTMKVSGPLLVEQPVARRRARVL